MNQHCPCPNGAHDEGMTDFTADFGRTADDYATHRAGFPESLWDRLADRGIVLDGARVLDLGTGTGTAARALARRGARVIGVDISSDMLSTAETLAHNEGLAIDWAEGSAEATGLSDRSVDLVVAGQCWHWFDGPAAFTETARVLTRHGRLVICHFDWLPLPGNLVAATEALIERFNPAWPMGGGNGFHPAWATGARTAGFQNIETFTYDVDQPYTHAAWRGRIRASAGVGGTLPVDRVAAFDTEHTAVLAENFPDEPLVVPHRVFALIASPEPRIDPNRE